MTLAIHTFEAHTAVRVPSARALVFHTSVADINRLQPRLTACITYIAPSERMIADCRLVVLPTIQRLFTWCYGSIDKSEEACQDSEYGGRTGEKQHAARFEI